MKYVLLSAGVLLVAFLLLFVYAALCIASNESRIEEKMLKKDIK